MSEAPAIAAEGLVKNYGKTKALAGFDLVVPRGSVYGLVGPNGAGKTTLLSLLSATRRPDRGMIRVRNTTLNQNDEVVQVFIANLLVPRRPSEAAGA